MIKLIDHRLCDRAFGRVAFIATGYAIANLVADRVVRAINAVVSVTAVHVLADEHVFRGRVAVVTRTAGEFLKLFDRKGKRQPSSRGIGGVSLIKRISASPSRRESSVSISFSALSRGVASVAPARHDVALSKSAKAHIAHRTAVAFASEKVLGAFFYPSEGSNGLSAVPFANVFVDGRLPNPHA